MKATDSKRYLSIKDFIPTKRKKSSKAYSPLSPSSSPLLRNHFLGLFNQQHLNDKEQDLNFNLDPRSLISVSHTLLACPEIV